MSDNPSAEKPEGGPVGQEEMNTALFANLIIQQANMAMMLLGKMPHPESGETMKDLEAARLFIDQLEMIEAKTKGNLNKQEEGLLRQSLMNLHMAFVEAVDEKPAGGSHSPAAQEKKTEPQPATEKTTAETAPTEEEHRKKFTKKY
jgi:hypothetical protein